MGAPNQNIYNVNYKGVEVNLTPPNHRTPMWLAWLNVLLYPLQWLHSNFFSDYANGSDYPFYSASATYNIGDRVIDVNNAVYECQANNIYNISPHTNTGFAVGSYLFTSVGGSTDNLAGGTGINMANYTGPNGVIYDLLITVHPGPINSFNWADSAGNTKPEQVITPGQVYQLSYGVTVTWSAGTYNDGDSYQCKVSTAAVWWQVSPDYRGVRPRTKFNSQKLVLEGILNQYFRTTFRQPSNATLPDIFIENNALNNDVFIVGYSEATSSTAVYRNGEAINFVVHANSDYSFGSDFTIYVPSALYFTLAPTGVASVKITNHGLGYASPPAVSLSGGGSGSGFSGVAVLFQSALKLVSVINPGSRYSSQPTVVFTGGGSPTKDAVGYALPVSNTDADNTIRAIANRYVIAGMIYNIITY